MANSSMHPWKRLATPELAQHLLPPRQIDHYCLMISKHANLKWESYQTKVFISTLILTFLSDSEAYTACGLYIKLLVPQIIF